MANHRTKVTCSGIKKDGNRCRQTVGLVNGLCSSHRPVVKANAIDVETLANLDGHTDVQLMCNFVWTSGEKCKEFAVKDGLCNMHRHDNFDGPPVESNAELTVDEGLADILDEIFNFIPKSDTIDAEFSVEGEEEYPVKVARETIQDELVIAKEQLVKNPPETEEEFLARDGMIGSLVRTGELVDPEDIFAKYPHLVSYVAMGAVANKHLFAAYVIRVKDMPYAQAGAEFKSLKQLEDEISFEAKQMVANGKSLEEIQEVLDKVTELKNKRAVLMAHIEWYKSEAKKAKEEEEKRKKDWGGMSKDWEEGESVSLEERVKHFFGGLWNKVKSVVPQTLMAMGVILVALAVAAMFNMGADKAPAPKAHTSSVVHENTVLHNPSPAVHKKPTVTVVAPQKPAAHTVTYTVKAGDNLWTIAKKLYGDSTQWSKLYNANKSTLTHDDVRNVTDTGHWIHVGQVIVVPGDSK